MNKDLIISIPQIPSVTFSIDPEKIQAIKDQYPLESIPTDLSDKDSYEYVVNAIRVCRESRGTITKDHKKFKAPFLKAGKTCDVAKNSMLAELQSHEDWFKTAKVTFDNIGKTRLEEEAKAKQEAMDKITTKLSWINSYSSRLIGKPASEVKEAIEQLKADDLGWAGDMVESAKNVVKNVIVQLENLHKLQVMAEAVDKEGEGEGVPCCKYTATKEEWDTKAEQRKTETAKAIADIIREKPAAVVAVEIVEAIVSGGVPHVSFK